MASLEMVMGENFGHHKLSKAIWHFFELKDMTIFLSFFGAKFVIQQLPEFDRILTPLLGMEVSAHHSAHCGMAQYRHHLRMLPML